MSHLPFNDVDVLYPDNASKMRAEIQEQAAPNREVVLKLASEMDVDMLYLDTESRFKDKTAAIIGGGPTIWKEMRDGTSNPDGAARLQALDERIDVIKVLGGTSHRLLDGALKNGADIYVGNTPSPAYVDTITEMQLDMEYWIATVCDPSYLDKLEGGDVKVWEALWDGVDYSNATQPAIGSGTSAPVAQATLMIMQGVSALEFYGVDGGGYDMISGVDYAYNMDDILAAHPPEVLEDSVLVKLEGNDDVIKVQRALWYQLLELKRLRDMHPEVTFKFHGESLNSLVLNKNVAIQHVYDPKVEVESAPESPENYKK